MELNLRGRTALVTGASKGIGRASAEALAAEGVNVILVSRTLADLKAARQKIIDRWNVDAQVHDYDLSDSERGRAGGGASRHRHPGQQRRRDPRRGPPAGHRGPLARGLGPEGVRLHQHVPSLLCRDEVPRAWRHHQHPRHGGREDGPDLYRRLDRQRRSDGVHQGARRLGGRQWLRVVGINPGAIATERLITIMKGRAKDRSR